MNFAASILEHDVETAEVFVSPALIVSYQWAEFDHSRWLQDNSGALLQDEEFIVTEDQRSGTEDLENQFLSTSQVDRIGPDLCPHFHAVKHKEGGFQSNLARLRLSARIPPS